NFTWNCVNATTVSFTGNGTPCPSGFSWNFGDPASGSNNTSAFQNPTHTFSGPGTYMVTLTASGPCNAPGSVTMPVVILGTTTTSTNVSCNGGTNGSAAVNVTGGSGTYTYSWSPSGGTGATASNLAAGTYSVDVSATDACPVTATVTITQPALL